VTANLYQNKNALNFLPTEFNHCEDQYQLVILLFSVS